MTDRCNDASRWLALRANGAILSPAEKRRFARWYEDAANRQAYEQVERLYAAARDALPASSADIRAALVATARQPPVWAAWLRRGRVCAAEIFTACGALVSWRSGLGVATAAVALAAFVAVFRHTVPPSRESHATASGATRLVELSDGSRVRLDSDSRFTSEFARDLRRVAAFEGRAVFSVQGDPRRPFVIEAGTVQVRVVGTEFQVDRGPEGVAVSVSEGVVEIMPATGSPEILRLVAGQRITVDGRGRTSGVASFPPEEFAPWRSGRIEFRERPLGEIIAEADRYFDGVVALRDPALRDLPVTGSFQIAEATQFLESLELIAPIKIRRVNARMIEVEAKK